MELSVVVPIFNEADNLSPLVAEITAALAGRDYELILVDDGSSDGSFEHVTRLAREHPAVKGMRLRRNFGQSAALAAGFDASRGRVIVTLDGDRQNDPADIPRLLDAIHAGVDVVSGWRRHRQDPFFSRRLPSLLANRLIAGLTGVGLRDFGCTLKAYRREILDEVHLYGEMHRFLPVLASQAGARVVEVAVNHRPRIAGVSKYGLDRTLRVLLDLVTVRFLSRYATRPMQLFGRWAFWTLLAAMASGTATLYLKWADGLHMNRNPLLYLTAFLLFSGVQFIALGLLGELITRTYFESQDKPIYLVRERINLPESSP